MKLMLLPALLFVSMSVSADNGKVLHDQACLQCHSSLTAGKPTSLYSRSERKVSSFSSLQKRVTSCAVAADVSWTTQQRNLVVNYLNKRFYKF